MAWRPTRLLIEGELDNTNPNKVSGWMRFLGLEHNISFDLAGNFHRDIRGAKIRFSNDEYENEDIDEARKYMSSFAQHQTGKVGDITRGIGEGADYVSYGYVEFYSNENGRVVIELEPEQIELLTSPIPAIESDPIDRNEQRENMREFMDDLLSGSGE